MKAALLCFAVAVALYACSRDEPATAGQPQAQTATEAPRTEPPRTAVAQTKIDETRQAETAADAGKPLSDTSLTQIVKAALQSESSLNAQRIDVENRNGNVALHGMVDSEEQREKAGRIVASVGGVRNVTNNLAVDPSASTGSTSPVLTAPRIDK